MMIDLDQPASYSEVDRSDMLARVMEFDRQVDDAWTVAQTLTVPERYRQARSIVVLGMGGSAIGGDLVRSLALPHLAVPMIVSRDYHPPAFVGPDTLVLASSYSGGTEETLAAVEQVLERGAMVLALTTGGALARLGEKRQFPALSFSYEAQPRAALGYSLFLTLGVLVQLGYLAPGVANVEDAISVMRAQRAEIGPEVPTAQNRAKELATMLHGSLPVIYGGGLLAEVARRWKGQLNENSKNWAFFEQLPELNHNAVMGYQFPPALAPQVVVVFLTTARNHPRLRLREEITARILGRRGVRSTIVNGAGSTDLSQMISAIQFGDFTSYYLALLNGIDPSTIEEIDYLKAELAQR
jgi:glucose/mannose-6-phosphate isomerase